MSRTACVVCGKEGGEGEERETMGRDDISRGSISDDEAFWTRVIVNPASVLSFL